MVLTAVRRPARGRAGRTRSEDAGRPSSTRWLRARTLF